MSPIDIIKQVFSDRGFSDFRDATTGSPPTLEYCVQYRETDFNFVCRLMEQFGVYYFFEHADGKHTLVLADAKSSHKPVPAFRRCPTIRSTTPGGGKSNISRPGRSGGGRRAAFSFSRIMATRNPPPTCSRSRRTPAATPTIPWRCLTIPMAMSTRRAMISWTRASARSSQNIGSRPPSRSTSAASSTGGAPSLFPGRAGHA